MPSVSGTSCATFGTRLPSTACVQYHATIPATTSPARTPITGQGAMVMRLRLPPAANAQHRAQLGFDRGHERVALAAGFAAGADFDRVADRDLGFDRPMHGDLAGQVFLEPLDRLDDPALGRAFGDVVGRVVVELLGQVGVFQQPPAPGLFRFGRARP